MIDASKIKIEKNVPIPVTKRGGTGIIALLKMLEVGDSFVYPGINYPNNVVGYAQRSGIKVAVRKQDGGKYRIWRIEDETNGATK